MFGVFRMSSVSNNNAPVDADPGQAAPACMVCEDEAASITFQPCGHRIACVDCGAKMKKCLACLEPIVRKIASGL